MGLVLSLIGVLLVGAVALIAHANIWNARRRAAMTEAERAADDAENEREANIW